MSASAAPEPAIKSYFFGKGYRDLRDTIADSWRRNFASARREFAQARLLWPRGYGPKALAVLRWTAGVSVVGFGTLFFLLFSVAHVTLLLALFLLVYSGFTVVYLAERAYLVSRGFFTVCPECHSKRALPEYFCPRCNIIHRRLIPSSYGILHHSCNCGERLPATFFLGRGRLQARCRDCHHLLHRDHIESRKCFIPIFGGPSVGKSAYLFSAVQQLIERALPRLGMSPSFVDSRAESDYEQARQLLENGRRPTKTVNPLPRAFTLQLKKQGQSHRMLYLYDPAGEAFAQVEGLVLHKYHEYLSGLILLIDPFGIPAVRNMYQTQLCGVEEALKPSTLPVEDALARVLISMEEHFGLRKTGRIRVPVAVVINKIDAFDLEETLGEVAVQRRMKQSPGPVERSDARDDLIRGVLIRWNQGDLVQHLEARCARLRYFSCSSLGRIPDGSQRSFEARGVLEPLLWILGKADSGFSSNRLSAVP